MTNWMMHIFKIQSIYFLDNAEIVKRLFHGMVPMYCKLEDYKPSLSWGYFRLQQMPFDIHLIKEMHFFRIGILTTDCFVVAERNSSYCRI